MAQVYFNTSWTGYVNAVDTQTVTVTGASFSWTPPTFTTYFYANNPYVGAGQRELESASISIPRASGGTSTTNLGTSNRSASTGNGSWSGAVSFASGTKTFTTSTFFSSSNPTVRTLNASLSVSQGTRLACYTGQSNMYASATSTQTLTTVKITLDVPPTFDVSSIYYDTAQVYAGLTTASVDVSNLSAKYGGNIDSAVLTIGTQTDTRTTDGTLSIALNAGGTFTPTVTVTDSRGQTATETLDPITVNVYTAPSLSFDVDRTTATGVLDDEGAYATVDATFTFTDAIATLQAPTITATDEDGVQTTPTVTWYSSRGADGTLSGSVTWSSLSSGDTVYALLSITGGFNTQKSYQISVTPEDSESTGTPITQTLSTAFYTLDFLAGGHGIAFGKPARNVGFECAMDATFEDTLTAQDMTAQEVDDFVDSLVVGGGGTAVDLVVEQGTSGIWTYRKWSSGIAECWGTRASISAGFISWANGWYYSYFSGIALPFTFIDVPVVTQHCYSSGNDIYATGASIGNFGGLATTTNTGGTTLYRAGSGTIAIVVQYYVVGRWK